MENKYRIIDTHAHYDDEAYDEDRAEVLKQIKEAGVEQLMNISHWRNWFRLLLG